MSAVFELTHFRIPGWVRDLESFRRWATSDDFPERLRISHLLGDMWVDLTPETVAHNLVKSCVSSALYALDAAETRGTLLIYGMRLSHPEAGLSTEPDAMYFSNVSLERRRVQLLQGADSREVVGGPDMVLEVVSNSSVEKDTVILLDLYWRAGVDEYWLINPRGKEVRFDLYHRGARLHGDAQTVGLGQVSSVRSQLPPGLHGIR